MKREKKAADQPVKTRTDLEMMIQFLDSEVAELRKANEQLKSEIMQVEEERYHLANEIDELKQKLRQEIEANDRLTEQGSDEAVTNAGVMSIHYGGYVAGLQVAANLTAEMVQEATKDDPKPLKDALQYLHLDIMREIVNTQRAVAVQMED